LADEFGEELGPGVCATRLLVCDFVSEGLWWSGSRDWERGRGGVRVGRGGRTAFRQSLRLEDLIRKISTCFECEFLGENEGVIAVEEESRNLDPSAMFRPSIAALRQSPERI